MKITKMICDRCGAEINKECSCEYTIYKGCKMADLCETCTVLLKCFIERTGEYYESDDPCDGCMYELNSTNGNPCYSCEKRVKYEQR